MKRLRSCLFFKRNGGKVISHYLFYHFIESERIAMVVFVCVRFSAVRCGHGVCDGTMLLRTDTVETRSNAGETTKSRPKLRSVPFRFDA